MTTTLIIEPKESVKNLRCPGKRHDVVQQVNLSTLADDINAEHEACFAAANYALDHALRCGELLIEAKAECAHGTWQQWLADNFHGSDRTARAYMRIAAHREAIEAKRQTTADLTIENALNYIVPRPEKITKPEPEELRQREQQVEDGLAELVLEFDDMINAADALEQPHSEAYENFYPDAGNGIDQVPTYDEHRAEVEQWRSAEWYPAAEKRVRARRDNPCASDAETLLELIASIDFARKKAGQCFLDWMKESQSILSGAGVSVGTIENLRWQAVWWDRSQSVAGTWQSHVKPGHWRKEQEEKIAARVQGGGQ